MMPPARSALCHGYDSSSRACLRSEPSCRGSLRTRAVVSPRSADQNRRAATLWRADSSGRDSSRNRAVVSPVSVYSHRAAILQGPESRCRRSGARAIVSPRSGAQSPSFAVLLAARTLMRHPPRGFAAVRVPAFEPLSPRRGLGPSVLPPAPSCAPRRSSAAVEPARDRSATAAWCTYRGPGSSSAGRSRT
jgi:hypothetical protein